MEAARNPEYPQAQVVNVPIRLWEASTALEFMRQRIKLHQQAQNALELPLCTGEERWAKPDVYAVMKAGRKSAVKLCTTEDEALTLACSDKNFYVVYRPGMSVRCEAYCSCLPFCSQGQSLIKKQKPNSNEENSNVFPAAIKKTQ
jgi:hypothetical protein